MKHKAYPGSAKQAYSKHDWQILGHESTDKHRPNSGKNNRKNNEHNLLSLNDS